MSNTTEYRIKARELLNALDFYSEKVSQESRKSGQPRFLQLYLQKIANQVKELCDELDSTGADEFTITPLPTPHTT